MKISYFIFFNFLFLFILTGSVFASIEVEDLKESYYYGEPVQFNVILSSSQDAYGFFTASLICSDSDFEYFRIPLFADQDKKITIEVEPIIMSSSITKSKSCYILTQFISQNNKVLFEKKTNSFLIKTGLELNINILEDKYSPKDVMHADVVVNPLNDNLKRFKLDMVVNKKIVSYESRDRNFTINYTLPENMPSGNQKIIFEISDAYGNLVKMDKIISISQIPSKISTVILRKTYYADQENESIKFTSVLYDQGGDKVLSPLNIQIINPKEFVIYEEVVDSNKQVEWFFSNNSIPGEYKIISKYQNILSSDVVHVLNKDYNASLDIVENNLNNETDVISEITDKAKFNIYYVVGIFIILLLILVYFLGRYQGSKSKKNKKKQAWED